MASYRRQLQREFTRRDNALANMNRCGRASAAIVIDTVAQTQRAVRIEIENLKSRLNPKNIIREHPWWAMLGSLLAGNVARQLMGSNHNSKFTERPDVIPLCVNRDVASREIPGESVWKPIIDAALENLPGLINALIQKGSDKVSNERPFQSTAARPAVTDHKTLRS
jgi:hypothetical protein